MKVIPVPTFKEMIEHELLSDCDEDLVIINGAEVSDDLVLDECFTGHIVFFENHSNNEVVDIYYNRTQNQEG